MQGGGCVRPLARTFELAKTVFNDVFAVERLDDRGD
jgi:hypothetical protein